MPLSRNEFVDLVYKLAEILAIKASSLLKNICIMNSGKEISLSLSTPEAISFMRAALFNLNVSMICFQNLTFLRIEFGIATKLGLVLSKNIQNP